MKEIFKKLLGITAGLTFFAYGVIIGPEYADLPGIVKGIGQGRTKNSISTIVAGIVGREIYGDSKIELEIEKHFWPDAKLTGSTTKQTIDTKTDLLLTSAEFKAETDMDGYLKGKVYKSEFNWKVRQTEPNTYEISRFGPKFDSELELNIEDGVVKGTYRRFGPHFDWDVKGTYDSEGNVKIKIDGPLCLGVTLKGKISEK